MISEMLGFFLPPSPSLSVFLHGRRIRAEITRKRWNSLGKLSQKQAMEESTTETAPCVTMVMSWGRKGWGEMEPRSSADRGQDGMQGGWGWGRHQNRKPQPGQPGPQWEVLKGSQSPAGRCQSQRPWKNELSKRDGVEMSPTALKLQRWL